MAKMGNKGKTVALGCLGAGILFCLMFFVNPGTSPVLFYIMAGVSGYFNGLIMASVYACMLDTIEYGQLKTGIRASAFAVSLCHFGNKLGMTIIVAVVGALMDSAGYVANQAQNPQVLMIINLFFTIIAGALAIIMGLVFLFGYKLDRKTYYDILEKLKIRQAEEAKQVSE